MTLARLCFLGGSILFLFTHAAYAQKDVPSIPLQSSPDEQYSSKTINSIARIEKQRLHVPKKLSPSLQITNITTHNKTLIIQYTIDVPDVIQPTGERYQSTHDVINKISKQLNQNMISESCSSKGTMTLMNHGIVMRYEYYNSKHDRIISFDITKDSCSTLP